MALVEAKARALVDVATVEAEAKKAAEAEEATFRAEAEQATEEALTTVRAEAEKAAEDEFGASFFQGYSDLKRRVALTHPK